MFFKKKKVFNDNFVKNINKKGRIIRAAQFLTGVTIVALAFNLLVLPSKIVYGMNGVGVMLNSIYGIDPSLVILIGSSILLILSYFTLGKMKTINSILGTLSVPILIKLTENINHYVVINQDDSLLIVLMGAALTGFGLGLVFKSGFSTGGTDILNMIISKKLKIGMGQAMIFTDGLIVLLGFFAFGFNKLMYALIVLYLVTWAMDRVLLGISDAKAFYIITKKDKEVKEYILKEMKHGVTKFEATGGYKDKDQNVLMSVIPTKEYYRFKEGIHLIDPDAFFVVTDAYQVFGGE